MNKGEFIKSIATKAEFTNKQAEAAYNAFVETVAETLKAGEQVNLVGFGTFAVKERAAREGINPLTKEKISIPASKVPALKFGKSFKDTL